MRIERVRLVATMITVLAAIVGGCGEQDEELDGTIAFTRELAHSLESNGVIMAMSADSSRSRTLSRSGGGNLQWSPDGSKLVSTSIGRLHVVDASGAAGPPRIISPKEGGALNPAWSPDGRRLVFSVQGDGWTDLRVVDADGSNERTLAVGSHVTGSPASVAGGDAWSPDGRKILYLDLRGYLAVMEADGSGRHRLLPGIRASGNASWASWSPNGKEIVFESDGGIGVVNSDGTGRRSLAPRGRYPVWSPDGRTIVFVESGGILVVNSDGSGRRKVGSHGAAPSWSPDGRRIVYVSYRDGRGTAGAPGDIYVVKADGSDERQLTNTPTHRESGPAWSPME